MLETFDIYQKAISPLRDSPMESHGLVNADFEIPHRVRKTKWLQNKDCLGAGGKKKRSEKRETMEQWKKRNRNDFAKIKCPRGLPSPDWLNRLSVYGRHKEILNFAAHVPIAFRAAMLRVLFPSFFSHFAEFITSRADGRDQWQAVSRLRQAYPWRSAYTFSWAKLHSGIFISYRSRPRCLSFCFDVLPRAQSAIIMASIDSNMHM